MSFLRALALASFLLPVLLAGSASAQTAPAQTIWRLLDYIAVDYPAAVEDGEVVSQLEYDEMIEFSATASERIAELPESDARADLSRQAAELERLIGARAAPQEIATTARGLAADLIEAYPVPLAPRSAPDVARGEELYGQLCASCHGVSGDADGPLSEGLEPPAIAFTEEERARERSIFALYQVIEQGLEDTSMVGYGHLPSDDRWALAFYSGAFAYPESEVAKGRALWESDEALRERIDLEALVATTPAALAEEIGEEEAQQLMAFLRRHPDEADSAPGSLELTRSRLDEALAAYREGDAKLATQLALSAYLDGFEPVEAILSTRDHGLMIEIEGAMAELRAGIARGEPVDVVQTRIVRLDRLFAQAERAIDPSAGSALSSFLAAFTILVREGLEAILIVMAMVTFLDRSGRRDVLRYVHGGWIAALVAGGATWALATWVIAISGASRELTEGFGALFAALVLLWVGVWMHGKSNAQAWQRYIRESLGRALNRRSAWFLFGLAFIVVYREVFETILFYTAIWSQGNGGAVLGGAAAASVVLVVIAFVMLRLGKRLPIAKFFGFSAALIAVLAVVLMGKGAAALQEAGYLPIVPWPGFPRSELLGMYPTRETILAQVAMVAMLALGFGYNRFAARRAEARDAAAAS